MLKDKLSFNLLSLARNFYVSTVLFAVVNLNLFQETNKKKDTKLRFNSSLINSNYSIIFLLNCLASLKLIHKYKGEFYDYNNIRIHLNSSTRNYLPLDLYKRENEVWLNMVDLLKGHYKNEDYSNELLEGRIVNHYGIQEMNKVFANAILKDIHLLLSKANNILDIGGGDGLYSSMIFEKYSEKEITILDLDKGLNPVRQLSHVCYPNKLQLVIGDARNMNLNKKFDIIMINELLELFPREEKRRILKNAINTLKPNGTLIITKFSLNKSGTSPISSSIFSLRMRLKKYGAYLETNNEVVSDLNRLGAKNISIKSLNKIKVIIKCNPGIPKSTSIISKFKKEKKVIVSQNTLTMTSKQEDQLNLWSQLIGLATSFRTANILFAATEMRLFDLISVNGTKASEIKKELDVNDIGIDLILKALVAIGLLEYNKEMFYLDPELKPLLTEGKDSIIEEILYYKKENKSWLNLDKTLLKLEKKQSWEHDTLDNDEINTYLRSVSLTNRPSAKLLVEKIIEKKIKFETALDIGGGYGDYSLELLSKFNNIHVTLIDSNDVIEKTKERFKDSNYSDRFVIKKGDALELVFSNDFDLIIISDVLHYYSKKDKLKILSNAYSALKHNGLLIICKFSLDDDGIEPLNSSIFSLKLRLKKHDAYLESTSELNELIKDAGFLNPTNTKLSEIKTMVTATKLNS